MVAQLPFNTTEKVKLNIPMIQMMDDGGNVGVLTANLRQLGVYPKLLEAGYTTLEIGCGSGYEIEKFYREGKGRYYGLEPIGSEYKIAVKRLKPFLDNRKDLKLKEILQNRDLEGIKVPAKAFDLIYSYHVFEHLENPLVMLDKAKKWLKPGGHLVITCPNVEGAVPQKDIRAWRCSLPSHRWLPGKSTLLRALNENGFAVEKVFTYGGHPAPRTFFQGIANRIYKMRDLGDVICVMAKVK